MLVRKLEKGLYEVLDDQSNNYRVEDRSRVDNKTIHKLVCPIPSMRNTGRWCIFEQAEGEWVYLDGNDTLTESLGVIETWAAASQLGK